MELTDNYGTVIAKLDVAEPGSVACKSGVWLSLVGHAIQPTLYFGLTNEGYEERVHLGLYYDTNKPDACSIAISDGPTGLRLQVRKGDEIKNVDLFDLITKLESM